MKKFFQVVGIAFACLFLLMCSLAMVDMRETAQRPGAANSGGIFAPPNVTLDEFNRVKTGMTYAEACQEIGAPGEVMSETQFMDVHSVMYTWSNGIANMNAMFQNDKLISKAQIGLQ